MLLELARGLHGGTVEWRMPSGTPVVTIVLKATFRLRPEVVDLVEEGGEPIVEVDETAGRGGMTVLRASELVPGKAQPEIMLVGSAFAPDELPVQSLVARMAIGRVAKSVEVFGERWWQPDATLGQPTPWLSFPLTYEHAGGGPATWNPIGVAIGTSGELARRRAPSLVLPGASPRSPSAPTPVACFAPIPRSWPIRQERADALRRIAIAQSLEAEPEMMVHQAAPTDQLLDALDGDELVVLDNLCRGSSRLSFRLPGIAPRVFVPGALGAGALGGAVGGVLAKADTVLIDTDREILTLVWRSRHRLSSRELLQSYVVEWARISDDPALAMAQEAVFATEDGQTVVTKNRPWLREELPTSIDRTHRTEPELELSPAPRAVGAPSPTPPPPPAASSERRLGSDPPRIIPRPGGSARPVLPLKTTGPRSGVRPAPEPATVRFAWCDARRLVDLQQHPHFRSILDAWKREPPVAPSLAPLPEDDARSEIETAFARVLSNAPPTALDGLAETGFAVMLNGPVPFLVEGELRLAFDVALELAFTARLASAAARREPRLQKLITQAQDLDAMALGASGSFGLDLTSRIRTVWAEVTPQYPPDFLQTNVREKLLAERAFTKRRVFGELHVRAELVGAGGAILPAYLPERAALALPLTQSIPVRMLADLQPRQEETESASAALRAIAIAVVVGRRANP